VVVRSVLAGFFGVMPGVGAVAVRYMGVVAGLFVISGRGVLGRHAMVLRGVLVMLFTFFRHGSSFWRYESRLEDTPRM
jgi:hypothetical protein